MSRKSLTRKVTDSYFPTISSPLRRSSNVQKIIPQVLLENDDEAERLALQRKSIQNVNIASNIPSGNKRYSLSLSYLSKIPEPQLKKHISHCIKLNIENKINVKNAFSLEMIDFMTFMVTKRNSDNIDLQLAGTSLDVMTKIYVYRVDGLYTDILKMAGALDKQQKENIIQFNEQENEENRTESPVRKKRKQNNHSVISTENALKGCTETIYPSQSIIGPGDVRTSDMLYQVVLPNHATSGFYYHPYNDVILDLADEATTCNKNSSEYVMPSIKDCSHWDMCSSFSDFKFLHWSHEDEPEIREVTQENNAARLQFDLDISSTEKNEFEPQGYFNTSEGEDNVNLCMKNAQQVKSIVDLRDILSTQIPGSNKQSEYSFIPSSFIHWAGPSYWKIKTLGKSLSNGKAMETCCQAAVKKKKEIVLNYNDNIAQTVIEKFLPGTAIKIKVKTAKITWKREKITLPKDVHYDILQLNKLYIYPSIDVTCSDNEDQLNATQLSEHENYDYNNENGIPEHCPIIETDNQVTQEKNDCNELQSNGNDPVESWKPLIGKNLVTMPKLSQKICLQYAQRAKKIDMHELKQTIWKSLISQGDRKKINEEMKESKAFSMIYKSLPSALSEANAKSLSLPIAFVSLLHLANEKSLNLFSISDFSDIIIDKN